VHEHQFTARKARGGAWQFPRVVSVCVGKKIFDLIWVLLCGMWKEAFENFQLDVLFQQFG
jgi:hypothetical protein